MSKKLGLALGGGGARGVVHIGFLKALEEEGIKPYCISGTSMGAVVGACYACGMQVDFIRDTMLKLKSSDIIDISVPFSRLSILRSNKLQKLLIKHIGDKKFEELEMPFSCTAVDLYSEKLYVFDKGSVALGVQASSCIPAVFKPVEHDGMLLVDGGVLCRVPVKQAKALGADVAVKMADCIKRDAVDPAGKILAIAHCNCPERAGEVKDLLLERLKVKSSFIVDTAGISTMYANDGGIIVVL